MTTSFQSPLDAALAHHRAGRLPQAEQGYRQILAKYPNDADALHLLGLLAHQAGHTQPGIDHIERAVALKPDPQFFSNLGELYRAVGQLDRGIVCCQRAIALAPNLPAAHTNLAALLHAANRIEEAMVAARQAVMLAPQDAAAHRILGNLNLAIGRVDLAAAELQTAVQLNPQDSAAWSNFGVCNERLNKLDIALQCHNRAAQLSPQSAETLTNLAHVLAKCNRPADAVPYFQRAVQINPNLNEAQEGLAAALEQVNRFAESIAVCKGIIARNPRNIRAYSIMGNTLQWATQLEEAEAVLRKGIEVESNPDLHQILAVCLTRQGRATEALDEIDIAISQRPDWVEAHFSKALILMFAGRFEDAWPHYEWRWKHPRMDSWRHKTDKPRWDGSPLEGKRIFIFAEQGLGDTFQFARFATLVAERGGHVILEVQKGIRELMQTVPGVKEAIERGQKVPEFDTYIPLLSLGGAFHTSFKTIPATVPYVTADPVRVSKFREIIGDVGGKFKVGIVWEGGPFLRENFLRSGNLAMFAPLAQVSGVRFYSLQRGPGAEQLKNPPAGMDIIDLEAGSTGFSDTAAAMANLDLIITVDTAVVHAAGAMGLQVWNLQTRNLSGHIWGPGEETTAWYPTMRMLRQPKLGDWPSVMEKAAVELRKLVEARKG